MKKRTKRKLINSLVVGGCVLVTVSTFVSTAGTKSLNANKISSNNVKITKYNHDRQLYDIAEFTKQYTHNQPNINSESLNIKSRIESGIDVAFNQISTEKTYKSLEKTIIGYCGEDIGKALLDKVKPSNNPANISNSVSLSVSKGLISKNIYMGSYDPLVHLIPLKIHIKYSVRHGGEEAASGNIIPKTEDIILNSVINMNTKDVEVYKVYQSNVDKNDGDGDQIE